MYIYVYMCAVKSEKEYTNLQQKFYNMHVFLFISSCKWQSEVVFIYL